jgi:predicted Zn-dependent peptidase
LDKSDYFLRLVRLQHLIERLETDRFPAKVTQLSHGLTVIHQYLPATAVVVADIWVRAGASAEPHEWSGMAHFLEHMIFKGTKYLLPGMFDRLVEHSGGMTNAATSHDYAHFFLTAAAPYLANTLPHLAEILLHAEIPDEEFFLERDVVLEEIRASYDDPDWLGFQALCGSMYQCHPYGRPILGDEARLVKHTPNQMRCFHRTYYQPENMTVAIVGGIEEDRALSLIEDSFAKFSAPSECPPSIVEAEPPLVSIRRTQMYLPRLEQARLVMGWMGPGVERLQDAFGLDLLSVILAGSRSSRLVRELQEEKHLVFHIESTFSLQRDSSLFTIAAWLEEEHLERVEQIIRDRLAQLQATPVSEAELERAQRLLINDYTFSTETPGQLAGLYGYYQTIATAQMSAIYPMAIGQFQPLELQYLADRYLSPERYAITIMQPC